MNDLKNSFLTETIDGWSNDLIDKIQRFQFIFAVSSLHEDRVNNEDVLFLLSTTQHNIIFEFQFSCTGAVHRKIYF